LRSLPVLERDEAERHVLALAREAEALHPDHAGHFRLLEDEVFGFVQRLAGALQRGAGGSWKLAMM
jgi:hypothetical protein